MKPLPPALAAFLRTAARAVSPGGRRSSMLVLMFHRVLAEPDPLLPDEPDAAGFAAQVDLISRLCNVIGLSEAVERLATGSLPPRAAAITFDDGYANNLDVAVPVLAARGLTATFYIATGFIDGGAMFNDIVIEAVRNAPEEFDLSDEGLDGYRLAGAAARRKAIDDLLARLKYLAPDERMRKAEAIALRAGLARPPRLMMSEAQLRELARRGMEVGAHCVTHPILTRIDDETARREIVECRDRLEQITGSRPRSFAYPNGRPGRDYLPAHVSMVRAAGFANAVSTAWSAATRRSDRFQIPRIAPWDRHALKYGLRLLRAYASPVD